MLYFIDYTVFYYNQSSNMQNISIFKELFMLQTDFEFYYLRSNSNTDEKYLFIFY